jgi:saccharopine dehydrogenase-like NADP-dependent oxidoreductase
MSILVLGATGFFGTIISRLLSDPTFRSGKAITRLVLAARDVNRCDLLAKKLCPLSDILIETAKIDGAWDLPHLSSEIKRLNITGVLNVAGPYPTDPIGLEHKIAKSCILAGVHYLDLADSSLFVKAVHKLDEDAKSAGVCVLSGCSTLPTISGAVIRHLVKTANFANDEIKSINIGISPGWRVPRGIGTTRSILETVGRPVHVLQDGHWIQRYGWGDPCSHLFPSPLKTRWLANLNVPDNEIWPREFPSAQEVRARAGLELPLFHFGTWLLGLTLVRGLDINLGLSPYADTLHRITQLIHHSVGSGDGGMYVSVKTFDDKEAVWNMIAADCRSGSNNSELQPLTIEGGMIEWPGLTQMRGPRVPCLPAVILAHRFASMATSPLLSPLPSGARPAIDVIDYCDELEVKMRLLGIETETRINPPR